MRSITFELILAENAHSARTLCVHMRDITLPQGLGQNTKKRSLNADYKRREGRASRCPHNKNRPAGPGGWVVDPQLP
jgi:hypothetical protein